MAEIIFAKLKRGEFRILFNGTTVEEEFGFLRVPLIENTVSFFDSQVAESDEWLAIDDAGKLVAEYSEIPEKMAMFASVGKTDIAEIRIIVKYFEDGIVWQKITPSKILTNERVLGFELDRPVINQHQSSVSVSGRVDAFYDFSSQRLYFKKMSTVNSMFPNLEQYYRQATDEERKSFLNSGFVNADSIASFGERTMKLIAAVLDDEMIDLSSEEVKQNVRTIAEQYADSAGVLVNFDEETGMFLVEKTKELQYLLQVLLGRYYINPVTTDKMHANYARKV